MSKEGLSALRARVHEDPHLAQRLRNVEPDEFAAEVTRVASGLGLDVAANDVREAIADGARAWMLRWLR